MRLTPYPSPLPQVPCRPAIAVVNLGFLDRQQPTDHLREGTKLDLPLWLLQAIRGQHRADGKDLVRVGAMHSGC